MRVIPEDSLVFMERELKRIDRGAERYNVIIIDPPSFSRSDRGVFQIEHDLERLLSLAVPLLNENGELIVITNCSLLSVEQIEDELRKVSVSGNKRLEGLKYILPPLDFPSSLADSIAGRGIVCSIRSN
jgi:23S rRNA G2069 N7-methylase RlmK/C1962 C5-methylase RlmI